MKFFNTREGLDFEELIKENYPDIKNIKEYKVLTSLGYEFTESQFNELFFSRRCGKSTLSYYKILFPVIQELEIKDNVEHEFKSYSFINSEQDTYRFLQFFKNKFVNIIEMKRIHKNTIVFSKGKLFNQYFKGLI